jgi:hypothetical protein
MSAGIKLGQWTAEDLSLVKQEFAYLRSLQILALVTFVHIFIIGKRLDKFCIAYTIVTH